MQQSAENQEVRPPVPPFQRRDCASKDPGCGGCVEHTGSREGVPRLHGGFRVA